MRGFVFIEDRYGNVARKLQTTQVKKKPPHSHAGVFLERRSAGAHQNVMPQLLI